MNDIATDTSSIHLTTTVSIDLHIDQTDALLGETANGNSFTSAVRNVPLCLNFVISYHEISISGRAASSHYLMECKTQT